MLTGLDLLVIVFMILVGVIALSISLMFLLKNEKAKKIFFYITSVLALYIAYVATRIGFVSGYPVNGILGILVGLVAIAGFVLQKVFRKNDKVFLISRISSASVIVLGLLTAFII